MVLLFFFFFDLVFLGQESILDEKETLAFYWFGWPVIWICSIPSQGQGHVK